MVSDNRMSYLRFHHTIPNPYKEPAWTATIEDATPFETKERAEVAKAQVAGASGVIYDDQEEHWYVVKA
jgi:hypothetical protein